MGFKFGVVYGDVEFYEVLRSIGQGVVKGREFGVAVGKGDLAEDNKGGLLLSDFEEECE